MILTAIKNDPAHVFAGSIRVSLDKGVTCGVKKENYVSGARETCQICHLRKLKWKDWSISDEGREREWSR